MEQTSKIFVAGHNGMVGSAVVRVLQRNGYTSVYTFPRAQLDLTDERAVNKMMSSVRPEYVCMAAAKVGGIFANQSQPATFIFDNLRIQNNLLHASYTYGVKRVLFLGSSCIYPKYAPQPIPESALLDGQLEPTNSAYAVAKIAGVEMCRSYNYQYGTRYACAIPTNLYGIADNYHPDNSHVLPALLKRIHEAKVQGSQQVTIWGDGKPMREFLFADDLAQACVHLLCLDEDKYTSLLTRHYYPIVNVGSGHEITIADLARLIAEVVGYKGEFVFDTTKPNGTMRKVVDSRFVQSLGWRNHTPLTAGIRVSYQDFLQRYCS